jgi:hypothetical protein
MTRTFPDGYAKSGLKKLMILNAGKKTRYAYLSGKNARPFLQA